MANKKEIAKVETKQVQQIEHIENLILVVRGKQVLLDRDLARLYGVETKRLKEQVRRNIERFPEDFMFQLSKEESELIPLYNTIVDDNDCSRSQFATLNEDESKTQSKRGLNIKYLPYAFTENGIAMLSSVLRSPLAIETNIRIMRAFTAMRHFVTSNLQMFQRMETIEHHQMELAVRQSNTEHKLEEIFKKLDDGSIQKKHGVFFDGEIFDAYTLVCHLVKNAKKRIVLFDNYVDESILTILDKREQGVAAQIYTKHISRKLNLDIEKHNQQYPQIGIAEFDKSHDRFLCIDDTVYNVGASLKDLGNKWFAFNRMELKTDELLSKM